METYSRSGDKIINPNTAVTTSMRRLIFCCHSGMRPVLRSMSMAPITLLVRMEPERMSSVSGGIFTSTSFSLSRLTMFSTIDFCDFSMASITWLILLLSIIDSNESIVPNSGRSLLIPFFPTSDNVTYPE